jgi:hypothetical protein
LTGDNHFTANLKVNGGVLMLNGSVTGTDLDIDSGMAVVNGVQHGGRHAVGVNGFSAATAPCRTPAWKAPSRRAIPSAS